MEIFISWHGKRSHEVAKALELWLPQIVNAFKPFLSSKIDKGARWRSEIAAHLADAKAGIICLTPGVLTAPWILFEAGALARSIDKPYACTFLVGLKPSDVAEPLSQFQATTTAKEDVLQLLKTLNRALDKEQQLSEGHVEKAFEKWWPDLDEQLKHLPTDEDATVPFREDHELLMELVDRSREMSSTLEDVRAAQNMILPVSAKQIPSRALIFDPNRAYLGPSIVEVPISDSEITRLTALNSLADLYKTANDSFPEKPDTTSQKPDSNSKK